MMSSGMNRQMNVPMCSGTSSVKVLLPGYHSSLYYFRKRFRLVCSEFNA